MSIIRSIVEKLYEYNCHKLPDGSRVYHDRKKDEYRYRSANSDSYTQISKSKYEELLDKAVPSDDTDRVIGEVTRKSISEYVQSISGLTNRDYRHPNNHRPSLRYLDSIQDMTEYPMLDNIKNNPDDKELCYVSALRNAIYLSNSGESCQLHIGNVDNKEDSHLPIITHAWVSYGDQVYETNVSRDLKYHHAVHTVDIPADKSPEELQFLLFMRFRQYHKDHLIKD